MLLNSLDKLNYDPAVIVCKLLNNNIKDHRALWKICSLAKETRKQMKGFPFSTLLPSSPHEYQRTGSPCLNRHIITHTHLFMHAHVRKDAQAGPQQGLQCSR